MIIDLEAGDLPYRGNEIHWFPESCVLTFKGDFKNDSQMHFNGLKRITILKAEGRRCYRVYSNPCFLATRPDFTYERRLELQYKKSLFGSLENIKAY